jgi:hypothetical protein
MISEIFRNRTKPGMEVSSRYSTGELVKRLKSYDHEDALISLDVDGCLRRSPTMVVTIKSFFKPQRWYKHPEWLFDAFYSGFGLIATGHDREDIETFSLDYAKEYVLPHLPPGLIDKLAIDESPPLFDGVKETLGHFPKAEKIIVSRGFSEIVQSNVGELGLSKEKGYHSVEDKGEVVLNHAGNQEAGINRILIFGDLNVDLQAAEDARKAGYQVDCVQVCKHFHPDNFDPRATIFVPRNWSGIDYLLKER